LNSKVPFFKKNIELKAKSTTLLLLLQLGNNVRKKYENNNKKLVCSYLSILLCYNGKYKKEETTKVG
jgi:hypothetical protein